MTRVHDPMGAERGNMAIPMVESASSPQAEQAADIISLDELTQMIRDELHAFRYTEEMIQADLADLLRDVQYWEIPLMRSNEKLIRQRIKTYTSMWVQIGGGPRVKGLME